MVQDRGEGIFINHIWLWCNIPSCYLIEDNTYAVTDLQYLLLVLFWAPIETPMMVSRWTTPEGEGGGGGGQTNN